MSKNIAQTDKNLAVTTVLEKDGISFYDVRRAPFCLYGLYDAQNQPVFRRLPDNVATSVSEGVAFISMHTAGGRVRFSTDSEFICIKAKMNSIVPFAHMPGSNTWGFDMFADSPEGSESRYVGTFMPPWNITEDGYESRINMNGKKSRYYTINFPSYCGVSELFVGVSSDSSIGTGLDYRNIPPIVYYGSSITQGGCASRPGNIYQNVVCRKTNIDYINLGFSGSAKGEDAIADYMATLNMSAFISAYDHNAPSREHLKDTHFRLYEKIRASHPDVPYIMISKCDLDSEYDNALARRDVVYESFYRARTNGDRNVYYIDGTSLFRGEYQNMCTVDLIHPNDLGFALIANAVTGELQRAFTQNAL